MNVAEVLRQAVERDASDILIVSGCPLSLKIKGSIVPLLDEKLCPDDTKDLIEQIYGLDEVKDIQRLLETGDDDFSFSVRGLGRFRCNAYKQRGSLAAVLRVVKFDLPEFQNLHIPQTVIDLYQKQKGLILITGPAGSGKSTTLACLIDQINHNLNNHVITIEDPIEYLHTHRKSIVSQRELESDTESYDQALRAALRQSPNVILLGEMRDFETIQTVLTAAETGQLVFSTLHTIGAAKTIDRIIDVFPANQQQQIRVQLSMVLQAVVSQQLIPTLDGGIIPAFEIMIVNSAVRNMIRESKIYQLDNVIYSGASEGMVTMDADLLRLYREGKISRENALLYSSNLDTMSKKI
ncbi:type IV pilus twitching motility protein PilT [Candidatus Soleaferrea massiliensis]|uniref:type IV pilus twitching motility protein PilT n=1 Tax=Candidatus Soleaferrea massiliensis TaxID=1470354 RepID=UPI00058E4EBE|nr:PilT/PilU family type 4a pilus ATPase [Candidatus Soleaferrea massiliensis]